MKDLDKDREKDIGCENIFRANNITVKKNLLNLLGNKESWEVVPKSKRHNYS